MVAIDPFLLVAVGLLVAGVVGAVVPLVPGPALSTVGVWVYWWSTGYVEPSLPVVIGLTLVGVLGAAVDLGAEAIGAKVGGASTLASVLGVLVGLSLLFLIGPGGLLVGVVGTILLVELYRGASLREGLQAALFAVVASLASGVVQAVLALSMLGVILVSILG